MSKEPEQTKHNNNPVRIIGIGNPLRGDDGAGHLLIDLLKKHLPGNSPGVILEKYGDNLLDMVSTFEKDQTIVLVDAAVSGKSPGKIDSYKLADNNLKTENIRFSTHSYNPLQIFNLARNLDCLPDNFYLYLVEGASFKHENALSAEVEKSVYELARKFQQMILNRNFKP